MCSGPGAIFLCMTKFFQDGLLPAVAVFHPQQEDGHTDDPQQDHSPKRESQGGTAQGAGYQQAPGTSEHNDHQKTGGGDGGEPGQNAQQVIGKEGQEKGQDEESVCFGPDDGEVLVGNGPAHQAVRKRLAQRACQEKDQQGGGEDRGDGKKKGGPGAEEHPAGGGAEVAGDGGQHHRQELEQEKENLTAENEGLISQIGDVRADIKLLEEEKTQFQKDKEVAEKRAEKAETELKKLEDRREFLQPVMDNVSKGQRT